MIALAAVSVCVMVSCGSKDGSKEKADAEQVAEGASEDEKEAGKTDSKAEEEIVAMINDIFDESNIEYSTNDEGYMEAEIDLITQYGSKRLCGLVEQVRKIDADKAEEDHFIADWNWLLSCWDIGLCEADDIDAAIDGNTAKVKYWISHSGQGALYELALVYEDGQWRVDDILTMGGEPGSKVEQMTKYINENK